MIVWNINPIGSEPIVIVTKWRGDPMGGPAIKEKTIMVEPGGAVDLSIVGLEPNAEKSESALQREIEFLRAKIRGLGWGIGK